MTQKEDMKTQSKCLDLNLIFVIKIITVHCELYETHGKANSLISQMNLEKSIVLSWLIGSALASRGSGPRVVSEKGHSSPV